VADEVSAQEIRFEWKREGGSSKHSPFEWSGSNLTAIAIKYDSLLS
jgi:hypothetical protein